MKNFCRARRFSTSHVDVKTTFCHLDRSGEISFAVEISRLHCVPLEMTKVSRNPVGDDAHIVPHSRENDSAEETFAGYDAMVDAADR